MGSPAEAPARPGDTRHEEFEAAQEERSGKAYGPLRPVVGQVVKGFLK
jgi:hypothetical protein